MFNSNNTDLGMESMQLYPPYYRMYGIRRAVQLVGPTLHPVQRLSLPRGSILHYVSDDETVLGIPQDDLILQDMTRFVMVNHNLKLGDTKGPPRNTHVPPNKLIRDYHRKYRKTRPLSNYESALRDPRTLIVENYGILPHMYRYTTSYFRSYYKWWNIQASMFERINEVSALSDRQQFMICKLPRLLPTLVMLRKAEATFTRAMLAAFVEPQALFILEMWKWLGEKRSESVLAKATPEALANMNLIFEESGRWFVLNLGLLDQWRGPSADERKLGAPAKPGSVAPEMLQKRFLRLLMFLFEARTVADVGGDVVAADQPTKVEDKKGPVDPLKAKAPVETAPVKDETPELGPIKSKPLQLALPDIDDVKSKPLRVKQNMDIDHLPEDDAIEETHANSQAIDDAITKDLEALNHLHVEYDEAELARIDAEPEPVKASTSIIDYVPDERSHEEGVMDQVNALADQGQLSGAEYRRYQALSTAYTKLPDPYGGPGKLAEQLVLDPAALTLGTKPQIPDNKAVFDKSMLKSSIFEFDSKYIDQVMRSDVLRSVVNLQQAGVAITGYEITPVEDAMNDAEVHSIQLTPVQGKPSTVRFTLPKVTEDGSFKANGVRYRMRKQRGDMPIRKLSPSKVALTSYYSKLFITRSEKQVHNYAGWLTNQIAAMGMDSENQAITNLMLSDVFDSNFKTPRIYSMMAQRFRSFTAGTDEYFFDYAARKVHFGEQQVLLAEKDGLLVMGRRGKSLIVVDNNDILYLMTGDELKMMGETGQLEAQLGISGKAPLEMVEVKVFNKFVPMGMFLAHHMGLSNLLTLLKANPRRVPTGERVHLNDDEYLLRFEDETLVFSRENRLATQVLAGFASFEKSTRNYPVHNFDKKDIYFNVLEQAGIGVRYLREMDLMVNLFIDPITKEILQDMGEPTDFIGLLLRANELLQTDWSPDETDMAYMRVKGYERIAGAVYGELVRALRTQRARGSIARAKIEMAPYAVWQSITQNDSALKLVEESNPIHNIKEKEEITYSGSGGRSDRSMTGKTRVFHENDMGVISEATKDSAAVAITTFLTADPNLKNLRGVTNPYDPKKQGPTSLLSSSALLAPAADRDDPKRVNFISIQQSAGTFAKGYRALPLRTGYEQIIAHRTDDLFAYTAKQNGSVTAISNKAITITYEDGSTVSVELGRRFGIAAGETFPHEVVTPLKAGDKVAAGDIVSYNSHYFEVDILNPKQVLWKAGVLVKTAVMESTDTLEDSSAISQRAADLLETQSTKVRDIVVKFDQTIHNLVQPGAEVDVESILCTIEDSVTAKNKLFDEDSLDTLRLIAANTPKAKFRGRVEKVEVFYHGEVDDMSPSLQDISSESDRNRKRMARDMRKTFTSGKVDGSMRVDARNLAFENAVIRIYISGPMTAGVGDKGVFGNQMKTIFGRVMSGVNKTEEGEEIDAIFGYMSISDRIVLSPEVMGTTITLLKVMSKRVADVYRGKTK